MLEGAGVHRDIAERAARASRAGSPAAIEQPLGALYSLFASIQAAGYPSRSRVRTFGIRADGVIAARLGLEESVPLVYLDRLRLAGDLPSALDQVWLPASLAEPLLEADFTRAGLYSELARRTGIRLDGGEERVNAVMRPLPADRHLRRSHRLLRQPCHRQLDFSHYLRAPAAVGPGGPADAGWPSWKVIRNPRRWRRTPP
ncbi:MAG TPA: GntR family transcriptional regulator [Trebonia sp.]|nr:GntR family transcriptional regulator [Trebonia sp.]